MGNPANWRWRGLDDLEKLGAMSAATDALANGLTELLSQLGKAFTYGGVSFTALTEPKERADDFKRGYESGAQWDTELVIDPTATAFSSGLPSRGEVVIQDTGSVQFTVVSTDYDQADHVAMLKVRKLG